MDLVLLNRQGLEFVIVLDDRSCASDGFCGMLGVRPSPLTPAGAVAVGQLRYRRYSLGIEFRPLLGGHCGKQAQIIAFDGEAATPRLKVANGAMPVQGQRWWLRAVAGYPDRVDVL